MYSLTNLTWIGEKILQTCCCLSFGKIVFKPYNRSEQNLLLVWTQHKPFCSYIVGWFRAHEIYKNSSPKLNYLSVVFFLQKQGRFLLVEFVRPSPKRGLGAVAYAGILKGGGPMFPKILKNNVFLARGCTTDGGLGGGAPAAGGKWGSGRWANFGFFSKYYAFGYHFWLSSSTNSSKIIWKYS